MIIPTPTDKRSPLEMRLDAAMGGRGSFREWASRMHSEGNSVRVIADMAYDITTVYVSWRTLYNWAERWQEEGK